MLCNCLTLLPQPFFKEGLVVVGAVIFFIALYTLHVRRSIATLSHYPLRDLLLCDVRQALLCAVAAWKRSSCDITITAHHIQNCFVCGMHQAFLFINRLKMRWNDRVFHVLKTNHSKISLNRFYGQKTSRKVYLEFLAYRAENSRNCF